MRILVCYGTTEGQTRKIAEFVAEIVRKAGHEPALYDVTAINALEPSRCQAAILAGSVHMGRYQQAFVQRIEGWQAILNAMPSAFISVSLSAASTDSHDRAEIDECAQKMLRETGWHPKATLHAAGAIRFSEYDFFKRWLARLIAAQMRRDVGIGGDQEFTDWAAVTAFVEKFLSGLSVAAKA